jgi:hypothetical protein
MKGASLTSIKSSEILHPLTGTSPFVESRQDPSASCVLASQCLLPIQSGWLAPLHIALRRLFSGYLLQARSNSNPERSGFRSLLIVVWLDTKVSSFSLWLWSHHDACVLKNDKGISMCGGLLIWKVLKYPSSHNRRIKSTWSSFKLLLPPSYKKNVILVLFLVKLLINTFM